MDPTDEDNQVMPGNWPWLPCALLLFTLGLASAGSAVLLAYRALMWVL